MLTKLLRKPRKDLPVSPRPSYNAAPGVLINERVNQPKYDEKLVTIARASIALSQLAPKLEELAQSLLTGAHQQSQQSLALAEATEGMTDELKTAIHSLSNSSSQVNRIVDTIKGVADQTKIIAINASIEAARAGVYGQAFGVVAKEVGLLADKTQDATGGIHNSIEGMKKDIAQAVEATGIHANDENLPLKNKESNFSVYRLNEEMHQISDIAHSHLSSADDITKTSGEIRNLCEELLLSVGRYRLAAHEEAKELFSPLLRNPDIISGDPMRQANELRRLIAQNTIFELFYTTDEHGIQRIDNIWEDPLKDGSAAKGSNWTTRPWYQKTLHSNTITVSDIYRSRATDNFCFTLSARLHDASGNFAGVLAADVNFERLL
ncbi:MAG: hypothetical protein JW739_04370 [Opitutales bacterium]|nr:hypothetical protein [Opitutales bacterium]